MPVMTIPKRLIGCDLIDLAAADGGRFVSLCERQYAARIEKTVDRILDSGCPVVMLTGPSSAGKTTSAHRLAESIIARGKKADVISLDDFFLGEGLYPRTPDGKEDFECPEALDLPLLRTCLGALCETGECEVPQFDFLIQQPSGLLRHVDGRGGAVIVEGLHALNPLLTEDLPANSIFRVYAGLREEYCDADGVRTLATRDVRLARRIVRDYLFRGHDADFTLDIWQHVCQSENKYIRTYKRTADHQLDTSFSYEPCIWEKILNAKREELRPSERNHEKFRQLCGSFTVFSPLDSGRIPERSMLREFVGPKNQLNGQKG